MAVQRDFQNQLITWFNWTLKARTVNACKVVNRFVIWNFAQHIKRQNSSGLRQSLQNQNTRHNRTVREMPQKKRLVDRHVFDGFDRFTLVKFQHPIHQQNRVAMRQHF